MVFVFGLFEPIEGGAFFWVVSFWCLTVVFFYTMVYSK